jgi:signal peptidase
MRKLLKLFRLIVLIVLTVLLILNLYSVFSRIVLKQDLPKVFGYTRLVIISGSMEPAIEAGDMIIVKECGTYEVNDIISFRSGSSIVTHRIIGFKGNKAITKGDFNNAVDIDPVEPDDIIGKVVYTLPKVGNIVLFLRSPEGILVLMLALLSIAMLPLVLGKNKGRE